MVLGPIGVALYGVQRFKVFSKSYIILPLGAKGL
jgi:hypothetical protein